MGTLMDAQFLQHGINTHYFHRVGFCLFMNRRQLAGRVPGSNSAAFQNSLTSCRMGNDNGCLQTGLMLFQGIGIKQDVAAGLNGESCCEFMAKL